MIVFRSNKTTSYLIDQKYRFFYFVIKETFLQSLAMERGYGSKVPPIGVVPGYIINDFILTVISFNIVFSSF